MNTEPRSNVDPSHEAPSGPSSALVFGASGYIGTHLVPRLQAAGWCVRAASRNAEVLRARRWRGVDCVAADALMPATLTAALAGIDVAYYLVHSMAAGRDFARLDLEAAGNFARAAATAGVKRIVYLGGLVPPRAGSVHLESRAQTGERLRAGPVPVTEIRAGIVVGPGSAAYEVIRDLVNNLPLMVTPRWVRSKSSPIALANLLEYLVHVATLPAAARRVLDAGGPDFISYETMMRQFGAVIGKHPLIVRMPVLSPRLSSYWLALVTTVPAGVASALIDGLKHDIVARDDDLRVFVPQRLLDFRQSVLAALEVERANAVAARWAEGALMFRGGRQDYAFYAKRVSASAVAEAPPAAVWNVVAQLGGATGYFYADALWRLRAWIDWLVGGPGLSRGRRHPVELRVGDTIDYWTVLALEPERRLTLNFGMKAPGNGVLEFELEPLGTDRTRLTVTAYWHPAGMWGLLYWHAFAPAHRFLFKGMTRAIARRAHAVANTAD